MTDQEILEILGTDPKDVSREQLACLSGEQLSWLSREQLSGLSGEQLAGLSGEQLEWLSGAQFSWLSGEQLACLSGEQLAGLSREQLAGLEEIQKSVPTVENVYTKILAATDNCSNNFNMSAWHCGTTHCAAGHIVTLAGDAGEELESKYDTPTAARMILWKSCPDDWPLPNFYASTEAAAAFIRKMAKLEAEKM